MTVNNSTNRYAVSGYIVAPTIKQGANYTTISSAVTQAVADGGNTTIFVKPGTYTEDFTWPAGINIVAFNGDQTTPNVTIVGKITASDAGTRSMSGVRLQTNSDNFLVVSGSVATVVYLNNCYLNCSNNTGISYTSSSSSSSIKIYYCGGDVGTTGISLFTSSSAGTLDIRFGQFTNSGGSSTASTISAGTLNIQRTRFTIPISSSGTGVVNLSSSDLNTSSTNSTTITVGGNTTNDYISFSNILAGTASAVSISASAAATLADVVVNSTNTNAITGAGTLTYSGVVFNNTSNTVNTTTQSGNYVDLGKYKARSQPAFLAYLGSQVNNVTGDGTFWQLGTTTALTEVFDQGGDFNTDGTFTAPVTGRYGLQAGLILIGGTAMTVYELDIATSNRTYANKLNLAAGAAVAQCSIPISCEADMDAGDTAIVQVSATDSGGKIDDAFGSSKLFSYFSGQLLA